MTLFFSLLPVYLLGNIHCLGMCGPLVALLGKHPFRFYYFLGRLFSFSLAGLIAGGMGELIHVPLKRYHFSEAATFAAAFLMIAWGIIKIMQWGPPVSMRNPPHVLAPLHRWSADLLLKENKGATLTFGALTIALPCGQTLLVFSACALIGEAWTGLWNGLAFALLTSPSLFLAMHTLHLFARIKGYDHLILGSCALFAGVLSSLRGLAEMGVIDHLVIGENAAFQTHLVIF